MPITAPMFKKSPSLKSCFSYVSAKELSAHVQLNDKGYRPFWNYYNCCIL